MNKLRDPGESYADAGMARGDKQVARRTTVFLILLAGISLVAGCKKSSESDAPNFFGSPPVVSELSITKEAATFDCVSAPVDLCCVDPPLCTCCCLPGTSGNR